MQVGELVAVALAAPPTQEGCPFCTKEKVHATNGLHAKYDEDTEADNDTDNSSGTLAVNLLARPQGPAREVPELVEGEDAPVMDMEMASARGRDWHQWLYDSGLIPVLYGAHHLIPGNDGLAASDLYQDKWLGPVDDGADAKNVGYNINGSSNGMWLSGNYAVRPVKGKRSQKTWTAMDPEFQKAYAFLAMLDTKRQFHDAHKPYSAVVRDALSDLAELMEEMKNKGCPACGAGSHPTDPPYHLNSRLNAVSNHLSKFLRRAPRFWKDPMFTSSWAKEYKDYVRELGGIENAKADLEKLRRKKKL